MRLSLSFTTLLFAFQISIVASRPLPQGVWCEPSLISFLTPRGRSVLDIRKFCAQFTTDPESVRHLDYSFDAFGNYRWDHPDFVESDNDGNSLGRRSEDFPPGSFWEHPDVIPRPTADTSPAARFVKRDATLAGLEPANLKSSFFSPSWLNFKTRRPCSGQLPSISQPNRNFLQRWWLMIQQRAHRILVQTNSIPDNLAIACAAAVFIVVMILLSVEQYSRGKKAEAQGASRPAELDVESMKAALTEAPQHEENLAMSPDNSPQISDEKEFAPADHD